MPTQLEAFFLPASLGRPGQRFCIFHAAQGPEPKGCILYIHPFAEEMNKSRRMAALQSRELARAGYAVLQIDLLGCGDSSGDFGDATWDDWLKDVAQGAQWLLSKVDAPLWLWGLRAGCLLAAQAADQLSRPCDFIFWAPSTAGKTLLQQFLRLKVAGDMLAGNAPNVTDSLRQKLACDESVEVAGYALSPGVAQGLEHANLAPPLAQHASNGRRVEWFELSTREGAALSPASAKTFISWTDAGFAVRSHVVNGPAFWQTSEIEEAPALVIATVAGVGLALTSVVA